MLLWVSVMFPAVAVTVVEPETVKAPVWPTDVPNKTMFPPFRNVTAGKLRLEVPTPANVPY